jgi:glucose-1-phosphate adenylyltransferase
MGADYYESIPEIIDAREGAAMGIGKDCFIENTIIDKNARIGDYVVIKGSPLLKDEETDKYSIKDGIIVLRKGVFIPSGTKIGLV